MIPRTYISIFIVSTILLPVVQGVLYWVTHLLTAMEDPSGARFLERLSLAVGTLWLLSLVVLLLLLALDHWLHNNNRPDE